MSDQTADGEPPGRRLAKAAFDDHVRAGNFARGPVMGGFGDGPGEPYVPNRAAWGTLRTGEEVWAWVRGPKAEEPA